MNHNIMLFISRHEPTQDQIFLATEKGFDLKCIGDVDAFNPKAIEALVVAWKAPHAYAVVNPAMALTLASFAGHKACTFGIKIAVFENENRAPEGEKPSFKAKAMHMWEAHCDASYGVFRKEEA